MLTEKHCIVLQNICLRLSQPSFAHFQVWNLLMKDYLSRKDCSSNLQSHCHWPMHVVIHMYLHVRIHTKISLSLSLSLSIYIYIYIYRSLAKKGPWAEHLTSLPKMGVGALLTVSTLTTNERPRHVYNHSEPSKQIIWHKIMYNGITSSFKVEYWRHTALWTVRCDSEHTVARG